MAQQLLQDQNVTFPCLVLKNWWIELVLYQANSTLIGSSFGRCFLWVEASNAPGDKCSVSSSSLFCPWDWLLLLSMARVNTKSLNFNQIEIAFFFLQLLSFLLLPTLLWEWSKQLYVKRRNENDLQIVVPIVESIFGVWPWLYDGRKPLGYLSDGWSGNHWNNDVNHCQFNAERAEAFSKDAESF